MDFSADALAEPHRGGILGRFENVREKKSSKKSVTCDAATPEYIRCDFLKPQHLPIHRVDHEANYMATSNINETRFHKGFQRKHKADIQQDAPRLEAEINLQNAREARTQMGIEATRHHRQHHTFNLLTGEGNGRECEFRQVGKKIVNPYGCMEGVFAEHSRDASNRIKNSKHRFFEHDTTRADPEHRERMHNIFNEGLRETNRETAILGYGQSGKRRTRGASVGTSDNYSHIRSTAAEPDWEPMHHGNASQIIFG